LRERMERLGCKGLRLHLQADGAFRKVMRLAMP
jgi:hypothetical protein